MANNNINLSPKKLHIIDGYKADHKYPNNLIIDVETPKVVIIGSGNVAAERAAIEHARFISPGMFLFDPELSARVTETGNIILQNLSKLINTDDKDGL